MEPAVAHVNGIRMHYRRAGDGPLVVLLHGWPQTWYCWRKIISDLARDHTVVAPDLRGYGHTDKPRTGYDKRTMATDVAELVTALGFDTAQVVGHDRGGRVAHRWALDRPEQVSRLAVLDIIPTREMWRRMDGPIARGYWHWLFHLQPDLPELLAGPNIGTYLGYFFERWTHQRHGLEPEAVAEYVRAFSAPGALRAGFDDYRASFPDDAAHDDADAGRKLAMPVLALWGGTACSAHCPRWTSGGTTPSTSPAHPSRTAATFSPRNNLRPCSSTYAASCPDGRRIRLPAQAGVVKLTSFITSEVSAGPSASHCSGGRGLAAEPPQGEAVER